MLIRPAQATDAAAIAAIHVRGWQVAYAGVLPAGFLDALSIERRTVRWQGILAQPRNGTLVCVEREALIGWVDHGPSRDPDRTGEAEVYAIYVDPAQWGRGVGTALMRRAEHEAFSGEVLRMTLWVLAQNPVARRFYERGGYIDDGARKTVDIGGASLEEMRYEKRRPA